MTNFVEYMECMSFWPPLLSLMALVLREALSMLMEESKTGIEQSAGNKLER